MIVPSLNIHHQDSDVRLWKWQARWCNAKLRHHSLSCRAPVHCTKNGLPCTLSQSSLQRPGSRGQNKRCQETKVVVLLGSCSALQNWASSLLAAEKKCIVEGGHCRWYYWVWRITLRVNKTEPTSGTGENMKTHLEECNVRELFSWRTPERSIYK